MSDSSLKNWFSSFLQIFRRLRASKFLSLQLPARLRKVMVFCVTRHEDGIRHGSTKLLGYCLDFRTFQHFVRPPVSCHHALGGPDRYHERHCCAVELTDARVVELVGADEGDGRCQVMNISCSEVTLSQSRISPFWYDLLSWPLSEASCGC